MELYGNQGFNNGGKVSTSKLPKITSGSSSNKLNNNSSKKDEKKDQKAKSNTNS